MKKITIHQLLLCIMLFFIGNSVFAQQQVDFTLKYNTTTSEYEVYGKPLQSGSFSVGGGSQLTVMLPASYANTAITSVTSVLGGPWADNTQLYAPSASPTNDFHSITTNGTAPTISFTAGQEHLIYKFTLTGGCVDGVRLYRNAAEGAAPRDPDSNGAGMQGSDFENYFAPVSTGNQEYRANYTNTGVSCFTASPNIVTTIGQPATPFVAGSPSNVPVTLTNAGTSPATGPIITTIGLPVGTSAPASFTTNGSTCNTSGQTVTCSTPGPISNTAPSNTAVLTIPVTPSPSTVGTSPTPFTAITTPVAGETSTADNTATPMTPTMAVKGTPDIAVSVGQPATPFVAGSPSNVPVTLTNSGTAPDAGPITSTITLPAGFSTPSTFSPMAGTTCNTSGQTVTCSTAGPLSNIAQNNTTTFNLPVTPAASTVGTTPTTTASVSSPNEPVANQGNNGPVSMTPTTAVAAAPAPDLVTTIGQPLTPFVAGSPSIVPVTVTNQGTSPTTGAITTTITLPTGTSAPATFTSGTNTCNTVGQTVTCTNPGPISNVSPNNTSVINVPVTPAASTVGTSPTPFTATPTTPGETVTGNNAATPMTPTTAVAAAPVASVKVNVKLFLQGAYETSTGMMRDDLRSKGYLPTAQPYSAMARTSYHTGTETTTLAVFNGTTGANAIVDWVLLELRTGTGAATRVATRAALVQRDGDVVDVDGISPVTFANRAAGSYYIVATHRNHLGVMSEIPVSLNTTATTCDFTGAYDGFGNNAMKAIGNLNALWAGNANHTGITHKALIYNGGNNDPDAVKNNVLTATGNTSALDFSFVPMGYHIGDTNLDGDVKYQGGTNDVDNMIFFNIMTHPTNTTVTPLHIVTENH